MLILRCGPLACTQPGRRGRLRKIVGWQDNHPVAGTRRSRCRCERMHRVEVVSSWHHDVLERSLRSADELAFVWEEDGRNLGFVCAHDVGFRGNPIRLRTSAIVCCATARALRVPARKIASTRSGFACNRCLRLRRCAGGEPVGQSPA